MFINVIEKGKNMKRMVLGYLIRSPRVSHHDLLTKVFLDFIHSFALDYLIQFQIQRF